MVRGDSNLPPTLQNRLPLKTEAAGPGDAPIVEGARVVRQDHARDVSSSKKSLQRRRWKGLGLDGSPQDNFRDISTALLQSGQKVLHLRTPRSRLLGGRRRDRGSSLGPARSPRQSSNNLEETL